MSRRETLNYSSSETSTEIVNLRDDKGSLIANHIFPYDTHDQLHHLTIRIILINVKWRRANDERGFINIFLSSFAH